MRCPSLFRSGAGGETVKASRSHHWLQQGIQAPAAAPTRQTRHAGDRPAGPGPAAGLCWWETGGREEGCLGRPAGSPWDGTGLRAEGRWQGLFDLGIVNPCSNLHLESLMRRVSEESAASPTAGPDLPGNLGDTGVHRRPQGTRSCCRGPQDACPSERQERSCAGPPCGCVVPTSSAPAPCVGNHVLWLHAGSCFAQFRVFIFKITSGVGWH